MIKKKVNVLERGQKTKLIIEKEKGGVVKYGSKFLKAG